MAEKVKALSDYRLDQTNVGWNKDIKEIDNLLVYLNKENFLGHGATAEVYKGEYSYPGQPENKPIEVAVKVISKRFVDRIADYEKK